MKKVVLFTALFLGAGQVFAIPFTCAPGTKYGTLEFLGADMVRLDGHSRNIRDFDFSNAEGRQTLRRNVEYAVCLKSAGTHFQVTKMMNNTLE